MYDQKVPCVNTLQLSRLVCQKYIRKRKGAVKTRMTVWKMRITCKQKCDRNVQELWIAECASSAQAALLTSKSTPASVLEPLGCRLWCRQLGPTVTSEKYETLINSTVTSYQLQLHSTNLSRISEAEMTDILGNFTIMHSTGFFLTG